MKTDIFATNADLFSAFQTVEQRTSVALYLIDSAVEPVDTFLDIDYVIYGQAVGAADAMSRSERLERAIALLEEILPTIQAREVLSASEGGYVLYEKS